ncbi:MAG TPA: hypothetical protein VE093_15485 [Polyangiaceae bacterium]|jgi:hypothetical protein|nr:hypothetical protein [Polyangiaceae bacterium]
MPTPAEMKRALIQAGFEVYATRGDVVHLADRVRENLIMDSGVFVRSASPAVGFIVRAQRSDFPHEGEEQLFDRARGLGKSALDRGYGEVKTAAREVRDPGDRARTLDTWCEVSFEKPLGDLAALMDEVRFALSFEKAVSPR